MKTRFLKLIAAVLISLPLLLTSCHDEFLDGIDGRGELVESTLDLDHFDGFINHINASIYLSQGDRQKVEVEAQGNIIDNIRLDVIDGKWLISYHHWVRFSKPVKIFITIPTLSSAVISGSGSVTGETSFKDLDNLSLVISGSGNMDIETESKNLNVLISGSGDFDIYGSSNTLDILVTGSGSVNAYELVTPKAHVAISGSGSVFTAPEDFLDVLISGSGSVFYRGTPEMNANISGSGRVRHDL